MTRNQQGALAREPRIRLQEKVATFQNLAQSSLFLVLLIFGVLGCSVQASLAIGTCGPTETPDPTGADCHPCEPRATLASITKDELTGVFLAAGIQNAQFTVSDNNGGLDISRTNLGDLGFKPPPPGPISLHEIDGSTGLPVPPKYAAFPSIRRLTLTWGPWTGQDSGVVFNATLNAQIDIHISADPFVVNPTLTLTDLPVTITFGVDAGNGNALFPPSQIVIPSIGSQGSVTGCGTQDWCDPLVRDPLFKALQSALPGVLASQFQAALNNSSPFWQNLLTTLAKRTDLPFPLPDRAGFPLPRINQATPGGTTTSWTALVPFSYLGGNLMASFMPSEGLCYIDCRPKPQSQICGQNICGLNDDGCGDLVTCPSCAAGAVCASNQCCVPKQKCAHAICGFESDGCGGSIPCGACKVGTQECKDGECLGTGGIGGQFCEDCRAGHGVCHIRTDGLAFCTFH